MLIHEHQYEPSKVFRFVCEMRRALKSHTKHTKKPNELYTKYEFYFTSSVDFIKNIILSNSWVFISFIS